MAGRSSGCGVGLLQAIKVLFMVATVGHHTLGARGDDWLFIQVGHSSLITFISHPDGIDQE